MAKLAVISDDMPAEPATVVRPRIVTALGKQTRGKTLLIRWLIERGEGKRARALKLIDADPHNPTLSRHFDDVLTPGSTALEDRRIAVEQYVRDQRNAARDGKPYDIAFDPGGGDQLLPKLAYEVRFTETLEHAGIDLIAFYMLGPNISDLEYFQKLEDAGFKPKHLVLAFNGGLISGDRSPIHAFDPILAAPLVKTLIDRGAVELFIPALAADCVEAVERSGAKTFREAIPLLDMWHEMRLETWLNDDMERQVAVPLAKLGWLV